MMITSFLAFLKMLLVIPKKDAYSRSPGNNTLLCLSNWIRSNMTTSLSRTASAGLLTTWTPRVLMPSGIMVGGPETVTLAPILVSPMILERATRLWAISPIIATFNPSIRPFRCRIVNISSRACVGCSLIPSPALMMPEETLFARMWGAPVEGCLSTIISGLMA